MASLLYFDASKTATIAGDEHLRAIGYLPNLKIEWKRLRKGENLNMQKKAKCAD